jgi:dTDP-4-amino-4,6-dideoxygalactose transaminase
VATVAGEGSALDLCGQGRLLFYHAVRKHLAEAGIATMIYYPVPVHQLPVYAQLNFNLPLTEAAAGEVLSLPIWPQLSQTVQKRVVTSLQQALA